MEYAQAKCSVNNVYYVNGTHIFSKKINKYKNMKNSDWNEKGRAIEFNLPHRRMDV